MGQFAMHADGCDVGNLSMNMSVLPESVSFVSQQTSKPLIEWDWDVEHQDRRYEAKADARMHGAQPFEVDRKVLKEVVKEKMGFEVGRIKFLNSGESGQRVIGSISLTSCSFLPGTFHKVCPPDCYS